MNDDAASILACGEASTSEDVENLGLAEAAKRVSTLVSDITSLSASLSARVKEEGPRSKERARALRYLNSASRDDGPEHDHIEASIVSALDSTNQAIERLDHQCKLLISNQRGMEEKIRKKEIDIERTSKRLESLRCVRPAYQDEYERLEEALRVEYEQYVVKLRNVDYLESELSSFQKAALERQKKAERARKRMQKTFREEELRVLNGGDDFASGGDGTSSRPTRETGNASSASVDEEPRPSALSRSPSPRERASFSRSEGSLSGPLSDGSESSLEGSDTGSSVLDDRFVGGDSDTDSDF